MRQNACITLKKELTIINSLYLGFSMSVLPSFEYYFNSLFLTFITGVCSEIPCSIVSRFAETGYHNSTDRLPHDAGTGLF